MNTALVMITHDLGVVAKMCDEVAVMYAGRIVEQGSLNDIFADPWHPYTKLLMESIPGIKITRGKRLQAISGTVPNPLKFPEGCRFAPRCPFAFDRCFSEYPEQIHQGDHSVSCFLKGDA
jgi:oligopeptide/dipeptide ABC transporter ATP-binding protein